MSQYEDKDRLLLRNLCFILGAKFTEKLNRKVTHLLCKVRDGQKYEAACKWDIKVTTAEWVFACISEVRLCSGQVEFLLHCFIYGVYLNHTGTAVSSHQCSNSHLKFQI